MCQHHQVYTTMCMCVSIFTIIFQRISHSTCHATQSLRRCKVRSLEWHLDDRYANKFAPLDSTAIYPKPGHQLLYTPMIGEMKCPRLYLCLAHSTSSPHVLMQHMHQLHLQMIWSTSYHHMIILVHRSWLYLLFTVAIVHQRQVLLKLHRHAVHHSKAFDLPFTLATGPSSQVLSWSSPPWSYDSMSCLMCI